MSRLPLISRDFLRLLMAPSTSPCAIRTEPRKYHVFGSSGAKVVAICARSAASATIPLANIISPIVSWYNSFSAFKATASFESDNAASSNPSSFRAMALLFSASASFGWVLMMMVKRESALLQSPPCSAVTPAKNSDEGLSPQALNSTATMTGINRLYHIRLIFRTME